MLLTAKVGPDGNSDGLLLSSVFTGNGNPINTSVGSTAQAEPDVT
jgi:hypothetical protein